MFHQFGKRLLSSAAPQQKSAAVQRGSPIGWMSLFLSIGVGAGAVGYYFREKEAQRERIIKAQTKSFGKPLLGGPFTLVNSEGKVTSSAMLFPPNNTTFGLLYFGFTHCPDICPSEMQKMTRIVNTMDNMGAPFKNRLLPIFITVDNKRDGVAQVGHYVKDFHPKTIGLTGTSNQLSEVCRSFRVYHVPQKEGEEEEAEDYLVDHSIVIYLLAPDGTFLDFFTQITEEGEAVQRIKQKIIEWESSK